MIVTSISVVQIIEHICAGQPVCTRPSVRRPGFSNIYKALRVFVSFSAPADALTTISSDLAIPAKFYLFSHTTLPAPSCKMPTPPSTARANGYRPQPSPLSSPANSIVVGRPGISPRPSPANSAGFSDIRAGCERELYNALVMERLGDNLETIFRRYRSGRSSSDSPFYKFITGAIDPTPPPATSPSPLYDDPIAHLMPSPYRSDGAGKLGAVAKPPPMVRAIPPPPPDATKVTRRPWGHFQSIRIDPQLETIARRSKAGPIEGRMHSPGPQSLSTIPLDQQRKGWDPRTIVWVGCQILRRLEHVHGKGIVHRDVVGR